MKTLTLLVCICALSACFSLSEGRKKPWKIYHKKNNVQQLTLDRQLVLYSKSIQPNWDILIKKYLISGPYKYPKPSRPNRRKPKPKRPPPSKCPVKSSSAETTTSAATTSAATTQIPSFNPTSPGVTPLIATTTSAGQVNMSSSAATPSPQPSPALSNTTAAPPTSSLPTPAPEPSSTPLGTTAAQNTTPNPSPTSSAPETSQTTAAPIIETTTPATTQNTTVEQTTSPSRQNPNSQFWQYIYEILKYISGVAPNE
ncbi:mucin-7 [Enhydra lutris kenyoni]|uniref:Mucin-7 n=1 Tax=Enhydra lutris kenyoni TaxID=391180 RepID=A0A2Y9JNA8_ENHLU|nr:mucin-7 [Enhydra lutris kenyoni]